MVNLKCLIHGHDWKKLDYTITQYELNTGLKYPEHQRQCQRCKVKAYDEPLNEYTTYKNFWEAFFG